MQARELAARLERSRPVEHGTGERFSGYGLVGLAFASGHVLAFRRFVASSIGPPFTTLWERDPDGRWRFHTNVDPTRSCPRYFAAAPEDARMDELELSWRAGGELWVRARDAGLHLVLRLGSTAATRSITAAAPLLPGAAWRNPSANRLFGRAAAHLLGTGPLTLRGRTPSGHHYQLRPRAVWCVQAAAAVLGGRDLGPVVPAAQPLALADFTIPPHGLLIAGSARFSRVEAR